MMSLSVRRAVKYSSWIKVSKIFNGLMLLALDFFGSFSVDSLEFAFRLPPEGRFFGSGSKLSSSALRAW